jgi:phosphoglycolate phosphatase-like HAD superfamily hydrolase
VIVGDTPLDVGCARAFGAVAVGVATGRHTIDDLTACRADHVFPDLSDTERVLAVLLDGAAG